MGTDHHEPTTDDAETIENPATQGPATDPALRVKNEAAEARATGETRPRTQTKPLKNQPLSKSPTTTLRTKTQQKTAKRKRKTKSQKNQSKSNSLSKSTWLRFLAQLNPPLLPAEKPTTATTS